ncbi:PAS domain-containing protein [Campylobacterota bacterium]
MKNFYKLVGLFVVLIISILVLFNSYVQDIEEDFRITQNQIRGIELIQAIQSSTMKTEAYYLLLQFQDSGYLNEFDTEIRHVRRELEQSLIKLQVLLKAYSEYKNQGLNEEIKKLQLLVEKNTELNLDDFAQINEVLSFLRAENYHVGDISTLNYEGEKEIYLFASVMIHYMPEFTGELAKCRALILRGMIDKEFNVDVRNEIVQSISLVSLSKEEIEQIVKVLVKEFDTGNLQALLNNIDSNLSDIQDIANAVSKQENISLSPLEFYELSKEIRSLSVQLHNENLRLLTSVMYKRNKSLDDEIIFTKFLLAFMSIISLIAIIREFINTRDSLRREKITDDLLIQTQDAVDTFTLVCKIDADGVFTYVNRKFCEVSGYTAEEIIGQSFKVMQDPDTPDEFFEQMFQELKNNKLWTGKLKKRKKDGEAFYLDMLVKPILNAENKIVEYIAISSDITELEVIKEQLENDLKVSNASLYEAYVSAREQAQLLEDQKELYDLVFKNTASSVLIIDIEANKFIDCNEPAIEILRCDSKEDVLNLQPAQLSPEFQPDGRRSDEKSDEMNALAVKKGSHTFEWKHLTKDGKEIWVEVILTPILLGHKKVLHVVWKDIEDKKQAAKEREEQQMLMIQQSRLASMGEMIGNISHQWRQPLNALGLTLQKLNLYQSRGILDDKKMKESVDKSMSLINTMSSTINDFRDFFNPNKEKSVFSVAEAIDKAYKIVESSFENASIEYRLELDDNDINVEGYSNEFSQVMLNLLNNAKDALIENKVTSAQVIVAVKKDRDQINISVCDNAGGIPTQLITKIFDPYFTTKEEGKGTGIGLYMSKMIIEDHMNGKLTVSNADEGACFLIRLDPV